MSLLFCGEERLSGGMAQIYPLRLNPKVPYLGR